MRALNTLSALITASGIGLFVLGLFASFFIIFEFVLTKAFHAAAYWFFELP
jgi:hypothetical protein